MSYLFGVGVGLALGAHWFGNSPSWWLPVFLGCFVGAWIAEEKRHRSKL